jgi:two-component sensor histidine kinase/DNA-binding response OmpR family regulator
MPKVLIVEDELLVADMAEEILTTHGYEVCGIARTVAEAVSLGRHHKPDLAVIDVRLADGELGTEVAARLTTPNGPGVLYTSGDMEQIVLTVAHGHACLTKPYHSSDLLRGLEVVADIAATGTAAPPFPRKLHILGAASAASGRLRVDDAAKVRKLLRQQAAIAGFGSFALRQPDLLKTLSEAARACAEGLDVPFSKVCRYREAENDLLIEAGHGWAAGVVGHVVSRADMTSPQGRAFVTGKPSICDDLREDNEFELPSFYATHGIISTIDVIIKGADDDRPYGVLEIDSDAQHDYDANDVNFLTAFANVLGEAVATAARAAILQTTIEKMEDLVEEKDRLLAHKNVLAAELQHRVRNNLQLVYAMLSKLVDETPDKTGQRGIKAVARRVCALADVYDHLLGSGMARTTDFGSYLKSLCVNLQEMHEGASGLVTLTCDSDSLALDLDVVTALGVVVAELVTNSYDHAFPGGTGAITVSARGAPGDERAAIMIIRDDGIGFSAGAGSKRQGLGLVRRLIEQIRGTLTLDTDHGTLWTLKFPVTSARVAGL